MTYLDVKTIKFCAIVRLSEGLFEANCEFMFQFGWFLYGFCGSNCHFHCVLLTFGCECCQLDVVKSSDLGSVLPSWKPGHLMFLVC